MNLFTKVTQKDLDVAEAETDKVRLTARLERGKLKKEISTLEGKVANRESKIETLQAQIKDLEESRDYYKAAWRG